MSVIIPGPAWEDESRVAGLHGLAFSMSAGIIECHDSLNRLVNIWKDSMGSVQESRVAGIGAHAQLTEQQIAAIKAVLTAHNPATPGPIAVNWGGFAVAFVPIVGGATQLRAAMKLYPSLILYFINRNAAGVQADVIAAKTAAHITAQQASDIVAAAAANGITLVVP